MALQENVEAGLLQLIGECRRWTESRLLQEAHCRGGRNYLAAHSRHWPINDADVVEPGFGLVTVTATFPACPAVAVPVAVSSVAETNIVVSACPPKFIFAPLTNRLPVTVSMNGPTPMLLGLTARQDWRGIDQRDGAGCLLCGIGYAGGRDRDRVGIGHNSRGRIGGVADSRVYVTDRGASMFDTIDCPGHTRVAGTGNRDGEIPIDARPQGRRLEE